MKISIPEIVTKSNQIKNLHENYNIKNNNFNYNTNNILTLEKTIINKNEKYNQFFGFKNNNINNNELLNLKRERTYIKKISNKNDDNNIIKIDLDDKIPKKFDINNNNNFDNNNEVINTKIFDIIKSDILDYDLNFKTNIKNFAKKFFWKNLIFRKYSGEKRLLIEIMKDIKLYNNIKSKKEKKYIKKSKKKSKIKKGNICKQKENKKNKNNNIIIIKIDNDEETDKEKNNINNIDITNEEEKLMKQMEKSKDLEKEYIFFKNFLYNENYFNENIKFFPDNFEDEKIRTEIMNADDLLRKKNSLKLYGILKLVTPTCKEKIFQKNIIYLEYLAYNIGKIMTEKYMSIIDMIYNRITKEALKNKNKNKTKIINL